MSAHCVEKNNAAVNSQTDVFFIKRCNEILLADTGENSKFCFRMTSHNNFSPSQPLFGGDDPNNGCEGDYKLMVQKQQNSLFSFGTQSLRYHGRNISSFVPSEIVCKPSMVTLIKYIFSESLLNKD